MTGCCGSNKMKSLAVTDVRVTDGGQGKASEGQETDESASFRVALFFYGRP